MNTSYAIQLLYPLTFQSHSNTKALLEPTERTSFPVGFIDPAILVF